MAEGVVSGARVARYGERWKWPLLAGCALAAFCAVVNILDYVGFAGTPWYGWWDVQTVQNGQPFTARFTAPQPGGAAALAGIHTGDTLDLRDQSLEARIGLAFQPLAREPIRLIVQHGTTQRSLDVRPATVWEGGWQLKLWTVVLAAIAGLWLAGCAFLITLRRARLVEGRLLALTLLCGAMAQLLVMVTPNLALTTVLYTLSIAPSFVGLLLLVNLSSAFGARATWRRVLEGFAYATIALNFVKIGAFLYGLVTLRIDPMPFGINNFANGGSGLPTVLGSAAFLLVVVIAVAAVSTTRRSERPRAAWLLLPLPIAFLANSFFTFIVNDFAQTWAATQSSLALAAGCMLVGAFAVSYALLKRRVLDLEFVLSRTLVFATISLIVVVAFVLLEWLLGTVLSGVSHVTGLVANASLALVLGVSMSYIQKRVDAFVDTVFFRKRHDDERALRDFSKEAAYVTDSNALLDAAIAKVESHTDARSGVLLLDGDGAYGAVRSFGDGEPPAIRENDGAILALKTWHKPLDPHHYETALRGALALPMLARGRLLGVLLLGERAGGEAYAPDEVEALSQFAHGVGSALDALAERTSDGDILSRLDEIKRLLIEQTWKPEPLV
jgi:hypothetical protein